MYESLKVSNKRCFWARDILVCFREVFKTLLEHPGVNKSLESSLTQVWNILNLLEQIKLQCFCSVKQKDSSETSKYKPS